MWHARKGFTVWKKEVWAKIKGSEFDVAIGSPDGAEVAEFVGLYLLSKVIKILPESGLYRDDGLAITYNINGGRVEQIKKEIVKIFKENHNLKITIDANLSVVNFLDVTFNLKNKSFYPYRKPNDTPLYVHRLSNHPKNIIKQLPEMINRRICEISCNEQEFNKAKLLYEDALEKSGFSHKMEFKEYQKAPKKRKRNVIWFNPPYSKNVTTNIGKVFLKMINKHFPLITNIDLCSTDRISRSVIVVCQTWKKLSNPIIPQCCKRGPKVPRPATVKDPTHAP